MTFFSFLVHTAKPAQAWFCLEFWMEEGFNSFFNVYIFLCTLPFCVGRLVSFLLGLIFLFFCRVFGKHGGVGASLFFFSRAENARAGGRATKRTEMQALIFLFVLFWELFLWVAEYQYSMHQGYIYTHTYAVFCFCLFFFWVVQ